MQPRLKRQCAPGSQLAWRQQRCRRGQSLTELVVMLPVLLLLVAGVLDLAHYFSVASICANAVREGARRGATTPTDQDAIKNRVVEEAAGAPLTLDVSEVVVSYPDSDNTSGHPIRVEVTHTLDLVLAQALDVAQPTIHLSATMVIF